MMQRIPWSQRMGGTISESGGMQHWLWNMTEMKRVRKDFLERVLAGRHFLDTFESDFFQAWDTFVRAEQEYITQYDRMSPRERMDALFILCDVESDVGALGYMNDIFLTAGGDDWLLEWFANELPELVEDRDQVIADLSTPVQTSFVQEERLALLRIGLHPSGEQQELLKQHQAAWHWVENSYIESEPLPVEHFAKKLQAMCDAGEVTEEQLRELHHTAERKQERKVQLYGALQISHALQTIIDCSDRISHMTDMRKMGVLRLNSLIWETFHDYAHEVDVPFETLAWMVPAEMRECVSSANWSHVEERMASGSITMIDSGEFVLVQGGQFTQLDLRPFLGSADGQTALKGQVAFRGVIEGVARIIRGRNDFAQFRDGDILITNQTTPEFIPLMKRAAAVVTEQGGITCHAAIVSRELKIPCIIGCTSAMTFFHNGQAMIVDGEKGEVRYV